jgi:hypothetical protein
MKKTFLTYTAIVEALTGLGLIIIPARVSLILLGSELSGPMETVLAMVAGAAIFSIAMLSWLSRLDPAFLTPIKVLLCYNIAVSFILLYAALGLGFKVVLLWGVIIFHLYQAVICVVLMQGKNKSAV